MATLLTDRASWRAPLRSRPILLGLACLATGAQAVAGGNPFEDRPFYVHPANTAQFLPSIATASGKTKDNLEFMSKVPSAYWLDKAYKVQGTDSWSLEAILQDAGSKSPPELTVFIWYDLPNRDCDAKASNGEMCCYPNPDGTCNYEKTGDCAEGIERYSKEYVDPFIERLARYQDNQPIVIIVEPDSLGNLATNTGHPHCGNIATQTAYAKGVQYSMQQLTTKCPKVTVYLDAAHGGWLGWQNNMDKFMKSLHDLNLPFDKIRGFATNVANYQALGVQCPWCPDQDYRNGYCLNGKHQGEPCCEDPCKLSGQYNFGNNEMNYAAGLVAAANAVLGMDAHVVIDTGRNGVVDQRQTCSDWCNPRGSGAGIPSTARTANKSLVDAYFWLKTPGESDGCSETLPNRSKCTRFDAGCASVDSLGSGAAEPHAPEAGAWYDYQVKQLATNAHFSVPGRGIIPENASAACPAASGGNVHVVPVANGKDAHGAPCFEAWTQCDYKGRGLGCCTGCTCVGGLYFAQCTPAVSGSTCSLASATMAPYTTQMLTTPSTTQIVATWGTSPSPVPIVTAPRVSVGARFASTTQQSSSDLFRPLFGAAGLLASADGSTSASTAWGETPPASTGGGAQTVAADTSSSATVFPERQPTPTLPYLPVLPVLPMLQTLPPLQTLKPWQPVQPAWPAQPVRQQGGCQKIWGQCKGKVTINGQQQDWNGPSCCEGSCVCDDNGNGQFYAQCRPPNNGWQCNPTLRLVANVTSSNSSLLPDLVTAPKLHAICWLALPAALALAVTASWRRSAWPWLRRRAADIAPRALRAEAYEPLAEAFRDGPVP